MRLFSAKTRIAFGQFCLLSSTLMLAIVLGVVPDKRQAVLDGRAKLCESVAINSSLLVGNRDIRDLKAMLTAMVRRNDDLLSAGVRRQNGSLVIDVGDHDAQWVPMDSGQSVDEQVQVAIHAGSTGSSKWGSVELHFAPLQEPGLMGYLTNPWVQLVLFVGALSSLLNYQYLGKMLEHLDPSKTVPGRVRSALNRLAEGLMVIDRKGRIVLANEALADSVGTSPDDLIGCDAAQFDWIEGEHPAEGPFPWEVATKMGTAQLGVKMTLKTPSGERRTFMVNATPVLDHKEQCRGVFTSLDDVTLLEDTKVKLELTKAEAEAANNAKSVFLAQMSHEIRTPMNAILGFTDVLRRGLDVTDADRLDYLNTIHSSGKHLLHLINDILDLSKVESGKIEVESRDCNPLTIVAEVVEVLQSKVDEKSIYLTMATDAPVPETIVTDPTRLRQIVTNLVGNAIKFTEQGGVRVDVHLDESGAEPLLAIDVVDTGIGMSAEAQQKIFDPFTQADSSVNRRFGGTGLGLSISKSFAEALGGTITVSSQEGVGTTFAATVATGPIQGVPRITAEAVAAKLRGSARQTGCTYRLPGFRILVTDDGDANRKLASLVLTRADAQVDEARNGQEAIDRVATGLYDAILMDVQMPVMDGLTATRHLRNSGCETPIIALTADAMKGAEERCMQAGYSDFLTKPIDTDALMQKLVDLLGGEVVPPGQEPRTAKQDPPEDQPQPQQDETPLVCSLPIEDPEVLDIVTGWTAKLHEQLAAMRTAAQDGKHPELAQLAHWLKGSAGTVGFQDFTKPALTLEQLARPRTTRRSPRHSPPSNNLPVASSSRNPNGITRLTPPSTTIRLKAATRNPSTNLRISKPQPPIGTHICTSHINEMIDAPAGTAAPAP